MPGPNPWRPPSHEPPSLPLLVLACAARAAVPAPAPASRFYAAVAMTKAQKNSSTPLDSGIYVREATGEWSLFGPRILGVTSLASSPAQPDVLLLASADGVVRTTDGGRSWRKTTGWEVADVRAFAFDSGNPGAGLCGHGLGSAPV